MSYLYFIIYWNFSLTKLTIVNSLKNYIGQKSFNKTIKVVFKILEPHSGINFSSESLKYII